MREIDARFERLTGAHRRGFTARNLSAQSARELGIRILRGRFRPGSTLPQEAELSAELGVSRTVVREAIKILGAKGFVAARPRLGTRVLESWHWQILDPDVLAWQEEVEFDEPRLTSLTEMRRAIEPAAAALAAERRTAGELADLRDALAQMGDHVDETGEFVPADARFHFTVLTSAHNPFFDALESAIFAGIVASIRVTNRHPADNPSSLPFHVAVFEAIRDGRPSAASDAMTVLLDDTARRLAVAFRAGREPDDVGANPRVAS